MKCLLAGSVALMVTGSASAVLAADLRPLMPVKAPKAFASDDWSGWHVGGHFGLGWGRSDWAANSIGGGVPLAGSLDLFQPFDASAGTGSYYGGLQAGYD